MTTNEENHVQVLREALQKSFDRGYKKGRIDSLKALSISLKVVADIGILSEEEKKGYAIAMDTINGALKVLEDQKEDDIF